MPAASTAASTSALGPARRCVRPQPERSASPAPSRRAGTRSRFAPPTVTPSRCSASVPPLSRGGSQSARETSWGRSETRPSRTSIWASATPTSRTATSIRSGSCPRWRRLRRRTSDSLRSRTLPRRPRTAPARGTTVTPRPQRRPLRSRASSRLQRNGWCHGARRRGRRKPDTRLPEVSSGHPATREPRGCPRRRVIPSHSETPRARARPGKPSPRRPMPADAPSGRRQGWRRCSGSGRSASG
jgi:hypothetical protein